MAFDFIESVSAVDLGVPRSSRGSGTNKIKELDVQDVVSRTLWVPAGYQLD